MVSFFSPHASKDCEKGRSAILGLIDQMNGGENGYYRWSSPSTQQHYQNGVNSRQQQQQHAIYGCNQSNNGEYDPWNFQSINAGGHQNGNCNGFSTSPTTRKLNGAPLNGFYDHSTSNGSSLSGTRTGSSSAASSSSSCYNNGGLLQMSNVAKNGKILKERFLVLGLDHWMCLGFSPNGTAHGAMNGHGVIDSPMHTKGSTGLAQPNDSTRFDQHQHQNYDRNHQQPRPAYANGSMHGPSSWAPVNGHDDVFSNMNTFDAQA